MAWKTNKNPLEYLEQRVNYYKKQLKQVKKWREDPFITERHSQEDIDRAENNIKIRIRQFEDACLVLAQNFEYE